MSLLNYENLRFLPVINGVTVIGAKKFEDFGIVPLNSEEITELQLEVFGFVL